MKHLIKKRNTGLLMVVLCAVSICLHAQKETEVFIPIGKSPGVSGIHSVMGKLETVKYSDSTITIRQETGVVSMRITANTDVYLDKSKLKLQNKKGGWADIKPGMTTEVKFLDNKTGAPAEWIKVLIE